MILTLNKYKPTSAKYQLALKKPSKTLLDYLPHYNDIVYSNRVITILLIRYLM